MAIGQSHSNWIIFNDLLNLSSRLSFTGRLNLLEQAHNLADSKGDEEKTTYVDMQQINCFSIMPLHSRVELVNFDLVINSTLPPDKKYYSSYD